MSMQVKFNNPKEYRPATDQGLEVLYAPARRQAFKLRWYLILTLVAAPFIFFALKIAHGLLIVEVPAQVLFPLNELRARDSAQITAVKVKEGDTIKAQQLLVEMDNTEWRLRLAQLEALAQAQAEHGLVRGNTVAEVLDGQLARAEDRLALVARLVRQGAATQGELMAAAGARDRLLMERLMLEQQETQLAVQAEASRNVSQLDAERQWLESRLDGLALHAVEDGVVTEVVVKEGENVGPGTPVLRVRNPADAQIYAYIDMEHASRAQTGQPMCIKLPDGEIIRGQISRPPQTAQSVPADIRAAFSAQRRDLLVTIDTEQPLPPQWLVQNLPLQVRFRCGWILDRLW